MSVVVHAPGLVMTEHEFSVPLDHDRPDGDRISVFAREVADPEGTDRPFLVFFEGGPGIEAPRPTRLPTSPSWLDRALREYRVLMLDQRGTGRSTPVGSLGGLTPTEQANYLKYFRADSIVRDAEIIRSELGVGQWSILGQSFGGFCALNYLSAAPQSLREAFFTGGLPPIGKHPDEVYRATYTRMIDRNRRFYQRYPADLARVEALLRTLKSEDRRLPGGDRLTPRRFRQVGYWLGMSDGAERLHYLLELPLHSSAFLNDIEAALPFVRNPIYAVIHEASYADGTDTRWAAARLMPPEYQDRPELFTGEHVFPWMFEDYGALTPLRDAANLLAQHVWPRLYDPVRLRRNDVPCSAAIYLDDPYVEHRYSAETARLIRRMRTWETNEFEHNALRAHGDRLLDRLIALARSTA
jgi:pimeloyl-ACP methyl ester carboxylesterase